MNYSVNLGDHQPSRPFVAPRRRLPWNFAEWFILSQTFLPALLYLPGTQPFRVPIRVASYGISLAALAYWLVARRRTSERVPSHPSVPWLVAALAYLGLMLVHPTTNSLLAGAAQIGLYLSVMGPVFWAPSFVESPERLRRLLWLLLLCCGINAFVGVMQVRDPDRWMPAEFSSVLTGSEFELGTVVYQGADGETIIRPPGLGDAPGAVCGPATFAVYLGLVFVMTANTWWKRLVAGLFATLGAAAIFFTLVRSSFLIAVGMLAVYLGLQLWQRRFGQLGGLLIITVIVLDAAFSYSVGIGGENLITRFGTITENNFIDFYAENRGNQVAHGFTELLPQYPFGAGLGRWGMMNLYFGDLANTASPPIWVEIQWPGWIVDGGVILLVLYPIALIAALRQQTRLAFYPANTALIALAGIIFAANAGLLALCFSYPVFSSPIGTQFWFLSGALHGVLCARQKLAQAHLAIPLERSLPWGRICQRVIIGRTYLRFNTLVMIPTPKPRIHSLRGFS